MAHRDDIECWLTDMDGVLVHENDAIPGASELLAGWAVEAAQGVLARTEADTAVAITGVGRDRVGLGRCGGAAPCCRAPGRHAG